MAGQFLLSIYGGYFGAGMGVIMLALFMITANMDIQTGSAIRILCGSVTNLVAALIFAIRGIIDWRSGYPCSPAPSPEAILARSGKAFERGSRPQRGSGLCLEYHVVVAGEKLLVVARAASAIPLALTHYPEPAACAKARWRWGELSARNARTRELKLRLPTSGSFRAA